MTTRRGIVFAIAGALATPFVALGQRQTSKPARIGYLSLGASSGTAARQLAAFRAGLGDFGYVEGKNIAIDLRSAEGNHERLGEIASALVRENMDVVVTGGTPTTLAAKAATTTIPIVFIGAGDPVASGLVASLARPGGNVTGTSNFSPPLMVKRLDLLKETQPAARRFAVLLNPANPAQRLSLEAMQAAVERANLELQEFPVRNFEEIKAAFASMKRRRVEAVVVANDTVLLVNAKAIADLASGARIPSAGNREFAEAGGLIGYGSVVDLYRYSARYVDKILKGAKPADLPVEQPSRFDVVLNLKTAEAIRLAVPQSLLVRAERVIE